MRIAIIQARMGSTRLPGKVLMDIGGQTMLERVLSRVRASDVDDVVLATPDTPENDVLTAPAVYRGSEFDVLARYYGAAQTYRATKIIRVTCDCPLVDPETINRVMGSNADYCWSQDMPGLDVECFTIDALRKAFLKAKTPYEREHVTPYLYQGHGFSNENRTETTWPYRVCVDTQEDLDLVRAIYAELGEFCTAKQIGEHLDKRTTGLITSLKEGDAVKINAGVKQKGLGG